MAHVLSKLSPELMTNALTAVGAIRNCHIASFDLTEIGEGLGFMGHVCRVTPQYSDHNVDAPRTLIAKESPTNKWIFEWVTRARAGERESHFYTICKRHPGIRIPRLYYAFHDHTTGYTLLLLEDLGSAGSCDCADRMTVDAAERFVTNLARFHAFWWNSPTVSGWSWLPALDEQAEVSAGQYPAALEVFLRGAARVVNKRALTVCENLGASIVKIKRHLSAPPVTLLHGDLQPNNILLPANGETSILIDWQACCRGRGMCDLAYFMILSLQPKIRHGAERRLLSAYQQELARSGIPYSVEECLNDYRWAVLNVLHFAVGINYVLMLSLDPRSRTFREMLVQHACAAVADHEWHDITL